MSHNFIYVDFDVVSISWTMGVSKVWKLNDQDWDSVDQRPYYIWSNLSEWVNNAPLAKPYHRRRPDARKKIYGSLKGPGRPNALLSLTLIDTVCMGEACHPITLSRHWKPSKTAWLSAIWNPAISVTITSQPSAIASQCLLKNLHASNYSKELDA